MPSSCKICAIGRKDEIIFPTADTNLENNDLLVLYVGAKAVKKVEKLFA